MPISIRFDQHARDVYVSQADSIATCSETPDILCLIKLLMLLVVTISESRVSHWTS